MKQQDKNVTIAIDSPFLTDLSNQLAGTREYSQKMLVPGGIMEESVTYSRKYTPNALPFTKLYQNQILSELSTNASRLFLDICLALEYNADKVYMTESRSKLSKRTYPGAVRELIERRIIAKEKRGWYWVNVSILVVGKLAAPDRLIE